MNIVTKYKIGDMIFFENCGEIIYGRITEITIEIKEGNTVIEYAIDNKDTAKENEIYDSLDEILNDSHSIDENTTLITTIKSFKTCRQ